MRPLIVLAATFAFSLPALADAAPLPSESACTGKAQGDACHYHCLPDCAQGPNDGNPCFDDSICDANENALADICGDCQAGRCSTISVCGGGEGEGEGVGEGEGAEGEGEGGATCACVAPSSSSSWSWGHAFSGACVVVAGGVFAMRRRRRA